ncbi:MAG: hypothetical protein OEZ38_14055 [Gammaproteobacteria bacterium]|nr:hypothetical protein [Gammaproteobacteria bacterium]
MNNVTVDAKALKDVLSALLGPSHHIRELIVIDNLPGEEGSISKLVRQYNEAVDKNNAEAQPEDDDE